MEDHDHEDHGGDSADSAGRLVHGWIWHRQAALAVEAATGQICTATELRRIFGAAAVDTWVSDPDRIAFSAEPDSLRRAYLAQRRTQGHRLEGLRQTLAEQAADRVGRQIRDQANTAEHRQ